MFAPKTVLLRSAERLILIMGLLISTFPGSLHAATVDRIDTAEFIKISDKILTCNGPSGTQEIPWKKWTYEQVGGTCCSHAVAGALGYNHGRGDIMANYLHKYTQYHNHEEMSYENGIAIADAMAFVNKFGVPALPERKEMCFGGMERPRPGGLRYPTGYAFPSHTTKYSFENTFDLKTASFLEGDLAHRIKQTIRQYHWPVVVGQVSCITIGKDRVFGLDEELVAAQGGCGGGGVAPSPQPLFQITKKYHALIFWGYGYSHELKEEGFLIKNSWGDGRWARRLWEGGPEFIPTTLGGNAFLSERALMRFPGLTAHCGWGANMKGDKDYDEMAGSR